jgi:hypothetical protein
LANSSIPAIALFSLASLRAHSEMGDGLAFSNDRSVNGGVNKRFKSDVCDSLIESKIRGSFEIDKGGNSAADFRQGNLGDWRRHCGFVGHDGVPWLWESSEECWFLSQSRVVLPNTLFSNGGFLPSLKDVDHIGDFPKPISHASRDRGRHLERKRAARPRIVPRERRQASGTARR